MEFDPFDPLKHSFSCTSNFFSVVFDIIYLHESISRDMNTLCTLNDPTVVHTCPLKSPHCNLLTVFREMITVSVHAWKDTAVWWSFLHDAQFNQNSHMQNICSVKLLCAVWRTYEGEHVGLTRAVLFADVFCFFFLDFTVSLFIFSPEKLSHAKEENLGMHQVLDQTLQELNSL